MTSPSLDLPMVLGATRSTGDKGREWVLANILRRSLANELERARASSRLQVVAAECPLSPVQPLG